MLLRWLLAQLLMWAALGWELVPARCDKGVALLAGLPLLMPIHAQAVDAEEAGLARGIGAAAPAAGFNFQ